MTIQNVIFAWNDFAHQELCYRSEGAVTEAAMLYIAKNGFTATDTYMNLLDTEFWYEKTYAQNIFLQLELKGMGTVHLLPLLGAGKLLSVPYKAFEMRTIRIPVPQGISEKVYFKVEASENTWIRKAEYICEDSIILQPQIAAVICTYHREKQLKNLIRTLQEAGKKIPGSMEIFVVDNASKLNPEHYEDEELHIYHNANTGGSGGFKRGMEEVVENDQKFPATHVLVMDDDVVIHTETIFRLYALLAYRKEAYQKEMVAGRMFRLDKPFIQYTAAEIWNAGDIRHIGHNLDMTVKKNLLQVNDNSGAQYSGWWFCCIPYDFVEKNKPLPFFLHCDDVEYGLRHGGTPLILNGIQVWHETYEYRQNAVMAYYDLRNSYLVNDFYCLWENERQPFLLWKEKITKAHLRKDFLEEYMLIHAFMDYMKGINWLEKINIEKYNKKLSLQRANKIKTAILWRIAEKKFCLERGIR